MVELDIAYRSRQWQATLDIAQALIPFVPHNAKTRAIASYAMDHFGRVPEAIEILLALDRDGCTCFPIHYNLASFACRQGHIDEARHWFRRSIRLEPVLTRVFAPSDEDLRPILDELQPTHFILPCDNPR